MNITQRSWTLGLLQCLTGILRVNHELHVGGRLFVDMKAELFKCFQLYIYKIYICIYRCTKIIQYFSTSFLELHMAMI